MIRSFSDRDTEELFQTESNRRFAAIARVALRKLIQMNHANPLDDLKVPPGNRLELLKGKLAGFHSIRVNDQWRIIFRWTSAGPAPADHPYLVAKQAEPLALRMDAHLKNAQALAEFLEAHPKIEKVLYPGLPSNPYYELNKKQARGAGGTFSFYVKGGVTEAYDLLGKLELFSQAVSLGGVESLIEYPWTMTHGTIPEQARREMGIAENLIRVSVGLEDIVDLLADFEKALA